MLRINSARHAKPNLALITVFQEKFHASASSGQPQPHLHSLMDDGLMVNVVCIGLAQPMYEHKSRLAPWLSIRPTVVLEILWSATIPPAGYLMRLPFQNRSHISLFVMNGVTVQGDCTANSTGHCYTG